MAGHLVDNKKEILSLPNGKSLITIVSKRPIVDHGKVVGVIGLFTDITELSQAKKRAEFASKAKSEFIANISHDLRTPITGMLGMMQDMLNTADQAKSSLSDKNTLQDPSTLKKLIETVQRDNNYLMTATEELLQLCNEVLEAVRLESGEVSDNAVSFCLQNIMQHNIELFQPTAHHKKLKLVYEIDQNIPTYLTGYRIYLSRVLLNLISNALKFTEKGTITVSVNPLDTNNHVGETTKIQILVKDTGIGIPKDKFDTIFEHFSRLTPAYEGNYKGAGLGLYTVKRYIEAMKGNIYVESELEQGSCFIVTLPFIVADHSDQETSSIQPL